MRKKQSLNDIQKSVNPLDKMWDDFLKMEIKKFKALYYELHHSDLKYK